MRDRRTLLVTGGAGFIGAHFVRMHLGQFPDDRVIVLDALAQGANAELVPLEERHPDRLQFVHASIRSAGVVEALVARADLILHLAADTNLPRSASDGVLSVETDILGTHTLASAALRHRKTLERFIHVSSSEVYGSARVEPMDEDHPLEPVTQRAAARCGADRMVHAFVRAHGLPAVIVRPFNVYGPGQRLEKFVPRLITSAVLNEQLVVFGDGSATRDWIHVEDVCRGLAAVVAAPLERVGGEVINLGSGRSTNSLTVAQKVVQLSDGDPKLIVHARQRSGGVARQRAGVEKALKRLDWKPETRLEPGLRSTIEWYWTHRAWWDRMRWMRHMPVVGSGGRLTSG